MMIVHKSIYRVPRLASSLSAALLVLLGLGGATWNLQQISCRHCIDRGCEFSEECQFFAEERIWSFLLIVTHLIPFALVPFTMCVAWDRSRHLLESTQKEMHLLSLQLGLAGVCVALAFEIGWHSSTAWYFHSGYHALNYLFNLFLVPSFALWADGFYCSAPVNLMFVLATAACAVLYPIGAAKDDSAFKICQYASLTFTFLFVTIRAKVVLQDWRMLWVPFFSVGVNLVFLGLLHRTDKAGMLTKWNYIYHMAHDLLGTELGVAVFAYLLYDSPRHRASVLETKKRAATKRSD
jgi:hypothetical protein